MTKRLTATVHVHDGTGIAGGATVYQAGTRWTKALGDAIPNPAAWREVDDEAELAAAAEAAATGRTHADLVAENEQLRAQLATAQQQLADAGRADATEPPRGGQGSDQAAWARHATQIGALPEETARDLGRDELIAAVDQFNAQQR